MVAMSLSYEFSQVIASHFTIVGRQLYNNSISKHPDISCIKLEGSLKPLVSYGDMFWNQNLQLS